MNPPSAYVPPLTMSKVYDISEWKGNVLSLGIMEGKTMAITVILNLKFVSESLWNTLKIQMPGPQPSIFKNVFVKS